MSNPLQQYQQVQNTAITEATPYQLIQLLLEGAVNQLKCTKLAFEQGNLVAKANHLGRATAIVMGLREALDFEKGGQIATDLDALYEYITVKLAEVSIDGDVAKIDEVLTLIGNVKEGWDAIASAA